MNATNQDSDRNLAPARFKVRAKYLSEIQACIEGKEERGSGREVRWCLKERATTHPAVSTAQSAVGSLFLFQQV